MQNIKEEIGRRILEARKAKGLTRKALSDLTDDLKPSRINNWERGDRTPGPEEVKQLSKVLEVSASYLMCLTDEKHPKKMSGLGALIPILNPIQACDAVNYIGFRDHPSLSFIPISTELAAELSQDLFAMKMQDESMEPEFRRNDILIIDLNKNPTPGHFVVAQPEGSAEVIVRRYKQLAMSNDKNEFELLALNTHWANLKANCKMIGSVCSVYRSLP